MNPAYVCSHIDNWSTGSDEKGEREREKEKRLTNKASTYNCRAAYTHTDKETWNRIETIILLRFFYFCKQSTTYFFRWSIEWDVPTDCFLIFIFSRLFAVMPLTTSSMCARRAIATQHCTLWMYNNSFNSSFCLFVWQCERVYSSVLPLVKDAVGSKFIHSCTQQIQRTFVYEQSSVVCRQNRRVLRNNYSTIFGSQKFQKVFQLTGIRFCYSVYSDDYYFKFNLNQFSLFSLMLKWRHQSDNNGGFVSFIERKYLKLNRSFCQHLKFSFDWNE